MAESDLERTAFEAEIRAFVGRKEGAPFTCPDPVNEPMIRHWCEVMGDANPIYTDPAAARGSIHGGIVAPPTMMQTWDMRGFAMRDPSLIQNAQRDLHRLFDAHGYTGVVATDTEQEFHRYLRPGDVITSETTIESISEPKTTALGTGYFVVTRTVFTDQNGEEVGWLTFRVLKFKPRQAQAAAQPAAQPAKPRRIRSPEGPDNGWWWQGFRDGKLLIQECSGCGRLRHPPRPMCGHCQSTKWQPIQASGRGSVHSYTVIHHPPVPGYEFPIPVGLIELEEGTRLVANIRGCKPEDIHIGMKVECVIEAAGPNDDLAIPFFYAVP